MSKALVPVRAHRLIPAWGGARSIQEVGQYITPDEAHRIIEAAQYHPRNYLLFSLLWWCGLRISEALSLSPLHFRDGAVRVKGKGDKWREVPLRAVFFQQVTMYCHDAIKSQEPLFPITRSQAHRLLQYYAAKAGIERPVHCHLFRHGFAVNLLKQGVNLLYLQRLLGHANIDTTTIYLAVAAPDIREAVERVEF